MEQQQRLKIESMEALIEESDRKMAKLEERKKKLETDNKELHDVCMKKQAENEQLKKSSAEKTLTIEQLKKSLTSQSKAVPMRQPPSQPIPKKTILANPPAATKDKENSVPVATSIRTASIDLHKDHGEKLEMRPQLQEAYNKLIKEIKVKNEPVKQRTDSLHATAVIADKKKVNTTINPYITQAWDQLSNEAAAAATSEEIFKKCNDSSTKGAKEKSVAPGKVANKSAITEERTHLRSNSHSNLIFIIF